MLSYYYQVVNKKNIRLIGIIILIFLCLLIISKGFSVSNSVEESLEIYNNLEKSVKESAIKVKLKLNNTKEILVEYNVTKIDISTVTKLPLKNEFDFNNIAQYNESQINHNTIDGAMKEKLKLLLNCCDRELKMQINPYGEYWLLENYIRGRLSSNIGCSESITYVANADYTFMGNLSTVVERWLAPVSFALYAPGFDYNATMDSIQYARNCLPASPLIRDYVTFHIFFPNRHMPSYIAGSEEEALKWPYDCKILEAPYANVNHSVLYKTQQDLTYPVNVGRNIARKAANTYFILASDIELFPTSGLVGQFLKLVLNNATAILGGDKPKVFPLAVFELKSNTILPNNKEDLQKLLKAKRAIPFHIYRCVHCHLVPNHKEWEAANSTEDLEVFAVGKRYGSLSGWEPFYISDNREPLFDERFTWEGQSDKRIQNFAMCLMDYEYHVLHPAFLVHSPGIKSADNYKLKEVKRRTKYVTEIKALMNKKIIPEYYLLYGRNSKCKI